MSHNNPYRAVIAPVAPDTARPRWSVMIPTYNCAAYLRETLRSVLEQDPGPEHMQIEVVDDCSTKDDPEAVVRELGTGRVGFFRQPHNVGHTRNFETCLQRSRGHLVHQLHGDDRVLPGFYEELGQLLAEYPRAGAAFCRFGFINEVGERQHSAEAEQPTPGLLQDWLPRIGASQRIQTPSIVVRRSVYEELGGFDRRLSWSEDWEMWVRVAAAYPVAYTPSLLAEYRQHQSSNTGQYIRTAENMRDLQRAIELTNAHMPESFKARQYGAARRTYANLGLQTAHQLWARGHDKEGAQNQLREAVKLNKNPVFLLRCFKLYLQSLT